MENNILYPHFLQKGDKISINAPARKVKPKEIESFIEMLTQRGFKVQLGKNVYSEHGPYAGTDKERLDDLQKSLNDPDIKAIFFARGGYGCIRLIDNLDFTEFKKHPKWLIGYSDICILHFKLQQMGYASIHAPMAISFVGYSNDSKLLDDTFNHMIQSVEGQSSIVNIESLNNHRLAPFEGPILGGNLAILYSLLGSNSLPSFKNAVLFLEDIGEYIYNIDRMMISLQRAGVLSELSGLIIGGMTDMNDNDEPFNFNLSIKEIIIDATKNYDYPIIFDFPAGHLKSQKSIILGKVAKCDGKNLYL